MSEGDFREKKKEWRFARIKQKKNIREIWLKRPYIFNALGPEFN